MTRLSLWFILVPFIVLQANAQEATLRLPEFVRGTHRSLVEPIRGAEEDTTHWMGISLGTPFVFDNTAGDGYYYLFFASEEWRAADPPMWLDADYHWCEGVARSKWIDGPYVILNDSLPIIRPGRSYGDWDGYHVLGVSVIENPEYDPDAEDVLNLRDDFTIEMQLYLDTTVVVDSYPRIVSKCKLDTAFDATETVFVLFDSAGGNIYARVLCDGTLYGDNPYYKPKYQASVYFGTSYDKSEGTLLCYLENIEGDWGPQSWSTSVSPGAQIDDSGLGELTLLNECYGSKATDLFTLLALRIQNVALDIAAMGANSSDRSLTATGGDSTILRTVFGESSYMIKDSSQYKNHGRIQLLDIDKPNAKVPGVVRDTVGGYVGIVSNDTSGKVQIYYRPRNRYLMMIEGATDAARIGCAFSDTLDAGWYKFPLAVIDEASSRPFVSGSDYHRLGGTPDPQLLYVDSMYCIIEAFENPENPAGEYDSLANRWETRYREASELFLLQEAESVLLVGGTRFDSPPGDTTDFDYNNTGAASVVNHVFPGESKSWTLAYAGSHNRHDKDGEFRYVNQVGLAVADSMGGTYTRIGHVLQAGPGIWDYYNTENPQIVYVGERFYIIYEARRIHTNDGEEKGHWSEIGCAKFIP